MSIPVSPTSDRPKQYNPSTGRPCAGVRVVALFADGAAGPGEAEVVLGVADCAAFARWVDSLPEEGNAVLKQLREGGFAFDLDGLAAQLRRAQTGPVVASGARNVGRRLLGLLARCGNARGMLVDPLP